MFVNTRKRLVVRLSAFTFTLLFVLIMGTVALASGPIVHKVSVGGPDACYPDLQPGCDSNFSLIAIEFADGRVEGQFTDRWVEGTGFHAVIDCLSVVGNEAWVSGVITHGVYPGGYDLAGVPVGTRIVDNGTNANDPPDQISYSYGGDDTPCTDHPEYELFDVPQGQVKVR